jgi:signal transduction histidine kinase
MTASQIVSLAACAGQLALALLCVTRAGRSPLAGPLGLLCLDVFGWMGAAVAFDVSGVPQWHWLDHALTPWTTPLLLQFVLTFVGQRRELRTTLWGAFSAGAALSVASAAAFVLPGIRPFVDASTAWSTLILTTGLSTVGYAVFLLLRHLRQSTEPAERTRTRLLLWGFSIATIGAVIEELGEHLVPSLGNVGLLAAIGVLSVVAFRFRLLDRDISPRAAGFLLAIATGGICAALFVFVHLGAISAMLVLGAATTTLAVVAASRRLLAEGAERQVRRDQLATLGRFTAQMAHDVKNPLAALKGAAQLLREDLSRPSPGIDRERFADLMLDQIDRLDGIVDLYGRLARVDPQREPLDVNETVRGVLALQSLASEAVAVCSDLAEPMPRCRADVAMLARVIENLVRNAMEAMPDGGTVVVSTAAEPTGVLLSVKDDGCGMDARTRERAFDDFFTTKPRGTGLGLAFVKRIVDAHGGRVSLESEPGRGTVVRVQLPRDQAG